MTSSPTQEAGSSSAGSGAGGSGVGGQDAGSLDAGASDTKTIDAADGGGEDAAVAGTGGARSHEAVCPGLERPTILNGLVACSATSECEARSPFYVCSYELLTFACGGAAPPPPECDRDSDCGTGHVCEHGPCSRASCVKACTPSSCPATQRCVQDRCEAKRCDEVGAAACDAGFSCDSADVTTATGCKAQRCGAGYACQKNWDCSPGDSRADLHGCSQRVCTADSDCDCGACVNAKCAPYAGACMNNSPPP